MQFKILRMIRTKAFTVFAVLAILLSVFAGCATEVKEEVKIVPEPPVEKKPSVERLTDGREGFIIHETPKMDEASQREFDRAVTLLSDQNAVEAIAILEKVIEQAPEVTAPYINIAIAYQQIGKPEKAEEYLKTALELFPDHPVAGNEYGLLYRKTGRFEQAREMYEKVLTLYPEYYPAHRNLGILCDLYLNDLECALEHYEIYNGALPENKQVELWIVDLRVRLGRN